MYATRSRGLWRFFVAEKAERLWKTRVGEAAVNNLSRYFIDFLMHYAYM